MCHIDDAARLSPIGYATRYRYADMLPAGPARVRPAARVPTERGQPVVSTGVTAASTGTGATGAKVSVNAGSCRACRRFSMPARSVRTVPDEIDTPAMTTRPARICTNVTDWPSTNETRTVNTGTRWKNTA